MSTLPLAQRSQPKLSLRLGTSFLSAITAGLLLGDAQAGPSTGAPPAVVGTMEGEIAKRKAALQSAADNVAAGDKLMADHDYAAAAEQYRKAVDLLPKAPMTAQQRTEAMQRYAQAAVAQARALGADGRFEEAQTLLSGVLAEDMLPDDAGARALRQELGDPEHFNPAMKPDHHAAVVKVQKLMELATGFIDLGDFNSAKAAYNQILNVDPHNTAAQRGLEKCEKFITDYLLAARDHTRAKMLTAVDSVWETPVPSNIQAPQVNDASGSGSTISAASLKLRAILFPKLNFESAELGEVIQFLSSKCREFDTVETNPDKKGVNFVIKLSPAEQAKLPKISMSLNNIPLQQALEYVAEQTGTKWKLTDGLVSFTTISGASGKLNTRTFSVPPGFLSNASTGDTATVSNVDPFAAPAPGATGTLPEAGGIPIQKVGAQNFLENSGIPFPKGASANFDRVGSRLIVTNTDENLDAVDVFVNQIVSKTTKQALIRVLRIEMNEKEQEEVGFDVHLGSFNLGSKLFGGGGTYGKRGGSGAPTLDYSFVDPSAGAIGVPTGQAPLTGGLRGSGNIESVPSISSLLASNRYAAKGSTLSPGIFSIAGAFTDPQFSFILRALNQKKGTDLSSAIEVVVKSGQIAKAKSVREFPYPTDFDPPQIPQTVGRSSVSTFNPLTGVSSTNSGTNFPVTPATPTTFKVQDVGNSLEVEATISEDGSLVDLRLTPTFTEFLGFINYGSPISSVQGGVPVVLTDNLIVQPVFEHVRTSGPTSVSVYDGTTIAFAGLKQSQVNQIDDKVPLLGDIPLIGRLFRSHVKSTARKMVVLFVTVKVQDPAGRTLVPQRDGAAEPVAGN